MTITSGLISPKIDYPPNISDYESKKEILEKLAFIRRHKEFASFGVKEQEVSYNPCLSEEDIKEFEHKHCITLPDDYRTFISEIGNGGLDRDMDYCLLIKLLLISN